MDLIKSITPTDEAWEEVNAQCDADDDLREPEDFIEECELEGDAINYGRDLVSNPEHREWMSWRLRRAKTITFGQMISWVRVSGGRGGLAIPCHPDWIRGLRDQCAAAGVLFRFDGWGEWVGGLDFYSGSNDEYGPAGLYAELQNGTTIHESDVNVGDWKNWDEDNPGLNDTVSVRVGAAASGRLLDGVEHLDTPAGVVVK